MRMDEKEKGGGKESSPKAFQVARVIQPTLGIYSA